MGNLRKLAEITIVVVSFGLVMALCWGAVRAEGLPEPVTRTAHPLAGCYAEISASGQFLEADRVATGGAGFGCDLVKLGIFQLGAASRFDIREDSISSGSFLFRTGFLVNPHLSAYPFLEWRVKDLKLSSNGTAFLGIGLETSVISDNLSAFIEASTAVSEFGRGAVERDAIMIRIGAHYRFNGIAP